MRSLKSQLEDIQDRNLVYGRDGAVVYETIIQREYPDVDIRLLCDLLADSLFDWNAALREYLREHGGKAL